MKISYFLLIETFIAHFESVKKVKATLHKLVMKP